jgi:hypothetical protein
MHLGLQIPVRYWSTERNDVVYRGAFLAYARIVFGQYNPEEISGQYSEEFDTEVLDLLAASLKVYLDIKKVESACVGMADMLNLFNYPADDEMLGRYRNFLNDVFAVEYIGSLEGKTLFMSYLQHVLDHPTQVPSSRHSVTKDIARWIFSSEMNNPRMQFGSEIIGFVERALGLLDEEQRMVIKANFGLNQPVQNLSEWAKEQGMSRVYASMLHGRGIEQFKSYFAGFAVLTSSTRYSVYAHWSLVVNGILDTYSLPTTKDDRFQILFKSVEVLPLPTRVRNCFREADIKTIGYLVQWTAGELLRLDNFGDGCLRKTKEQLANIGLSLGMKINFPFS